MANVQSDGVPDKVTKGDVLWNYKQLFTLYNMSGLAALWLKY